MNACRPPIPRARPRHGLRCLGAALVFAWSVIHAAAAAEAAPAAGLVFDDGLRRMALVIGNSNYRRVEKVPNAANDVKAVCQALGELSFKVTCKHDIETMVDFRRVVREFAESLSAEPKTVGVLYYAGHMVEVSGKNYFVPTAASPGKASEVDIDFFDVADLKKDLKWARNDLNIIILDGCRNNPFYTGTDRGLGDHPNPAGIDLQQAPSGSIIIYSTDADELAQDGMGRNSPFAKSFLAHVREPGLQVEQLVKKISREVVAETQRRTGHAQEPTYVSKLNGDFCFAGCGLAPSAARVDSAPPSTKEAVAPPPAAIEVSAPGATTGKSALAAPGDEEQWASALKLNTVAGFRLYLNAFPSGVHAEEARSSILGRLQPKKGDAASGSDNNRCWKWQNKWYCL